MAVKVLITDDSSFVRMLLKKILVANGYEVVGEADNGVEAVVVNKVVANVIPNLLEIQLLLKKVFRDLAKLGLAVSSFVCFEPNVLDFSI